MSVDTDAACLLDVAHPVVDRVEGWLSSGAAPSDESIRAAFRDLHAAEPDRQYRVRDAFVARVGFAAPLPSAVRAVADLGRVVEVGAGTGALSLLVQHAGGLSFATDPATHLGYGFDIGRWDEVHRMDASTAVRGFPDRVVLMSWPNGDWCREALREMRPGQQLVYLGEGDGGCCAGPAFFEDLDRDFLFEEWLPSVSFPGLHDAASLWRKR